MTTARERLAKLIKVDGNGLSPSVCDIIRELLAELDAKCRWADCGICWRTECGEVYGMRFKFCPHCGKEIVSE